MPIMIKKLDINVLDGLNTEINLLQMQQGTIDLPPISTLNKTKNAQCN